MRSNQAPLRRTHPASVSASSAPAVVPSGYPLRDASVGNVAGCHPTHKSAATADIVGRQAALAAGAAHTFALAEGQEHVFDAESHAGTRRAPTRWYHGERRAEIEPGTLSTVR